jgi:hypothetical protein
MVRTILGVVTLVTAFAAGLYLSPPAFAAVPSATPVTEQGLANLRTLADAVLSSATGGDWKGAETAYQRLAIEWKQLRPQVATIKNATPYVHQVDTALTYMSAALTKKNVGGVGHSRQMIEHAVNELVEENKPKR